jgi:hypothetical protein
MISKHPFSAYFDPGTFINNFMTRNFRYLVLIVLFTLDVIYSASGQTSNKYDFERIEDNSFLMEEAYNQEPGVIQHISSYQYMKGNTWTYTFTDEWPVPREKHQLSFTVPVLNNGETGFGDVLLNYRYQAILRERLAFSPRFSFIFPTGNYKKGIGSGVLGYQLNLPLSYLLSTKIATHYNFGVTFIPGARNEDGTKYDLTNYNWGFSMILLLKKNFNFMFEVVGNTAISKAPDNKNTTSSSLLINPGFRYAFNFKSGLQIVPGLALPVGIGSSKGATGLFAYLSFEHPFWKPR